ncbi:Protein kinase-like domain [Cordyceps militaris CM01]|uniref:Protein kinase-like domain n=1 Tax=Cordyceps militaris (strain CM01) TaxID=983644 RepID=G3JAY6_CORMM|nr:Protein kinase-like domain [Cordyceps militaris CM01]EGX95198.1 Protein kinase-like domain [Cordyceps militaris CM01]
MAVSINRVGYDERLAVVGDILRGLGLQASKVSTVAYDDDYKYPFNNFLFKVDLATPASSAQFTGTQAGTVKAPFGGVSSFIIKLSNAKASDANNANRVPNDVAAQHLVRQSLAAARLGPLIPDVYAWAPASLTDKLREKDFGWIISEFRAGVDLNTVFADLTNDARGKVLGQIAAAFAAIQAVKLPETVTKFGGIAFNEKGQIISAEAPFRQIDPMVDSYVEFKFGNLRRRFDAAGKSPVIRGWKTDGVDVRIEQFLSSNGPEKVLSGVDLAQKSLVHADFTTNNMLFDKDSNEITAILDFDFSVVSNPFDEYLTSFTDLGGCVGGLTNEVEAAILKGDFASPPADLSEDAKREWELADAWRSIAKKNGVLSPSEMKGADQIMELIQFQNLLCPHRLSNAFMLEKMNDTEKAELRAKTQAKIVQWLAKYGF